MDAILLLAGVFVIGFVIKTIINSKKIEGIEDYVAKIADFSATQGMIGSDNNTGLAIDEQRKKICLIDNRKKPISSQVLNYKDLLSSEIFEDGTTITKTVRSSQIGGALIGGLVFGGVGVLIGGLSGKRQSGKVKEIVLRLTVNSTRNPLHDVKFLHVETTKDNYSYKQAIQQVRHWHGLAEVLIKRADSDDKANVNTCKPKIQTSSVADEIKKLADLRDSGLLSIEEFQQQKVRILGACEISHPPVN